MTMCSLDQRPATNSVERLARGTPSNRRSYNVRDARATPAPLPCVPERTLAGARCGARVYPPKKHSKKLMDFSYSQSVVFYIEIFF